MTLAYRLPLLAGIALLGACASTSKTLQVDDQGQCPLTLSEGQQLILSLPSNPTTGFRWTLREDAGQVLKSLGPEVYSASDSSGLVGGDGQSTWRFVAQQSGEAPLLLTYAQPWDTSTEPAQIFDCRVIVK